MTEECFSVSLRIWHPTLSTDDVVKQICMKPEVAHSVGEQRTSPSGEILEGLYRRTYCCFELTRKAAGVFTDALPSLLQTIKKHKNFLETLVLDGGRSELFVGVFAEGATGFTLEPPVMMELSELSLELSVDIYN
ncbi:MAG: DUF4279 domain-containing protein [Halothiobacillus sp.]|nr:DUF4279 domain-containing protein [Halothiobacillus sp.]